jgi:hypothetical protein
MQKNLVSFLVIIYSLSSYSYDNPKDLDTGCNSKKKLSYFWNSNSKQCQAKLKVSDKISVTNNSGVFIVEHENKERVYSTWMNNAGKSLYKETLKTCPKVNTGCFVKDPTQAGTKLKTTGISTGKDDEKYFSILEGFDSGISDEQRINFKFMGNYKCGTNIGPRLVVNSAATKEVFALTSDSFKIEETGITTEKDCQKLNKTTAASKKEKPAVDNNANQRK